MPFLVIVRVKPAEGIHVNAEPPLSIIALDSGISVKLKKVFKSGEYLDPSKPIEVECRADSTDPGPHRFSFVVGYTYCSEKDGWCRMGKDTVFVNVRVKK
jgi:hypothetical protein